MHAVAATFVAGYILIGFWYAIERQRNPAVDPVQIMIEATLWFPIACHDAFEEAIHLIRGAR